MIRLSVRGGSPVPSVGSEKELQGEVIANVAIEYAQLSMGNVPDSAALGRGLRAARNAFDDLTSGQRWTAALMIALAVVVIAFGLPSATRFVAPETVGAAPIDSSIPGVKPPETEVVSDDGSSAVVGGGPSVPTATSGPMPATSGAPAPADTSQPDDPPTVVSVVALVDPDAGQGTRTDAAMAELYLARAGLPVTTIPIGDAFSTCELVGSATLAISGGPVPREVRSCLAIGGTSVLSFDDDRGREDRGLTVGTRRGVVRSLLDTAARISGELNGSVALVADERLRSVIEPALPTASSLGLTFDSTVWLADGEPVGSVGLDLVAEGVGAVVFATSTEDQTTIGSQVRTFSPGVDLVALDVADTITSSGYTPLLDGIMAVTSVQAPWHEGATSVRAACRSAWEDAQAPAVILDASELRRALLWCQHTEIAAALGSSVTGSVADAIRSLTVDSPVTSRLARLGDGTFGPTQIATVSWSFSCGCWSSDQPFGPVDDDV